MSAPAGKGIAVDSVKQRLGDGLKEGIRLLETFVSACLFLTANA